MSKHLISVDHISKSFGSKDIFAGLSFTINEGEHVALIGENGAGKTTLLRCLLGVEACDSGKIQRKQGLTIGYLPQESQVSSDCTVAEFLDAEHAALYALKTRMHEIEDALMKESTPALLEEYGTLQEAFQSLSGYDIDYRRQEILSGLQLQHIALERPLSTLSGGERRRLHLASLLLQKAELIILDEPTNHLDKAGIEWLETYIQNIKTGLLFISHDRLFLNRVARLLYELDAHTHALIRYSGNYDSYLIQKEERRIQEKIAFEAWKENVSELRALLKAKTFAKSAPKEAKDSNIMAYDRASDRKTKTEASQITNIKGRLADLENNPPSSPPGRMIRGIYFEPSEMQADKVIELIEVSKSPLFTALSLTISKGDRIVLTGPNGAGKTTLLKLMRGVISPDSGSILRAPSMRMGVLDQHAENLHPTMTIIEEYGAMKNAPESELRGDLHKYGLFGDEEVHKLVGELSEGQKQKLQIACLLAQKPNVLFLDEPTNHLDLTTLEQFEEALMAFQGVIIAVSHDRRFIEKIATRVLRIG